MKTAVQEEMLSVQIVNMKYVHRHIYLHFTQFTPILNKVKVNLMILLSYLYTRHTVFALMTVTTPNSLYFIVMMQMCNRTPAHMHTNKSISNSNAWKIRATR